MFSFLFLSASFCVSAQEKTVKGKVTDSDTNDGLPGVSILVKGTNRGTTTDATLSELFLDGAAQRMVVPNNSTWSFDALVTCRAADGTSAAYHILGEIKNNSGTVTLGGALTKTVLARDVAALDATVIPDNPNAALVLKVTGLAATSIRWVASVRTVEVNY